MVFILDQALHNTFVGDDGKHALYDWICWEYLIGSQDKEARFNADDINAHIRLVGERGSGTPYTAKELKWGNNPEFAVQQYDRIVSRWCFPEPRFVGSVVYVLYNIMCQCLKWAQLEKGKGDRFAGTEWDHNKGKLQLFRSLWHTVHSSYFASGEQKPWENQADMEAWVQAFIKEHNSEVINRHLTPLLVTTMFGWNADKKFPPNSLCGIMLRHIEGFVTLARERLEDREWGDFYNDTHTWIARQKEKQVSFLPTELFWFFDKENKTGHRVHHSDRTKGLINITGSAGSAVKQLLADIKKHADNNEDIFPEGSFTRNMVLSGYSPGNLNRTLQAASQQFWQDAHGPFQLSRYGEFMQLDFINGQVRAGELILAANFESIRKALTFRPRPTVRPSTPKPDPVQEIKQRMVPSDTVPQPIGTNPSLTREQKFKLDEKPSTVPLVIGAAAVLAFILFR